MCLCETIPENNTEVVEMYFQALLLFPCVNELALVVFINALEIGIY